LSRHWETFEAMTLTTNFRWKEMSLPTTVGVRKLERLLFHIKMLAVGSFVSSQNMCVKERQTERQIDRIVTAISY